jgi:hypothetical protein
MNDDWFGKFLLSSIAVLIFGMIFGIPAIMTYHYNLETSCVRSNNVKSQECFELFIRTGKTVNLNTQTWENVK